MTPKQEGMRMIKHFCDVCGAEADNPALRGTRLRAKADNHTREDFNLKILAQAGINDFCYRCYRNASSMNLKKDICDVIIQHR